MKRCARGHARGVTGLAAARTALSSTTMPHDMDLLNACQAATPFPRCVPMPQIIGIPANATGVARKTHQAMCFNGTFPQSRLRAPAPAPHDLLCTQDGCALPGSGSWCGTSGQPSAAQTGLPGGSRKRGRVRAPHCGTPAQGPGGQAGKRRVLRALWPHLGATGQELLPGGEVLRADDLPRQHSVAQEGMISA